MPIEELVMAGDGTGLGQFVNYFRLIDLEGNLYTNPTSRVILLAKMS